MKNMMKKENGFTLIELIIVIAILAIIAAVAIPNILGAVDNSRRSTDVANGKIILNAAAQVNAKDSNASIGDPTGTYTISATAITPATASTSTTAYAAALLKELNGAGPVPKYNGEGTPTGTLSFKLVVDQSAGTMVVYATNGTATADIQVAPTPLVAAYGQK